MISRVSLENWKSHKSSEFEFGKGTNVLVGILGAGKSAVMDAISYSLFGNFPALNSKNLKLDEIIMAKPNEMDFAKVGVEFEYKGKPYSVERTIYRGQRGNEAKLFEEKRLIAGPKPSDVNKKVEEILEVNYDLFSRAIYSEQNQLDYFLKLSPQQRKEKFDEILEIDKYEKVRANAVSISNRLKKSAQEKEGLARELKEKIKEGEIGELKKRIEKKRKEKEEFLEKIEKMKKGKEEEDKKLKLLEVKEKEFRTFKETRIKCSAKIESLEKSIREKEKEAGKKIEGREKEKEEKALREIKKERSLLGEKIREKRTAQARLQSLEEKGEFFLEEERKRLNEIPEKLREKEKIEKEKREAESKLLDKEKGIKEREKKISGMEKEICLNEQKAVEAEKWVKELGKAGADCPLCSTKLSEQKKKQLMDEKKREEKKIEKRIEEIRKEREKEEKELASREKERKEMERNVEKFEEWSREIKEIEEIREKLKKTKKEKEEAEKALKGLEEKASEEKEKELEEEERKQEKIVKALEESGECANLKEGIREIEKQLLELKFEERELLFVREKAAKRNAEIDSIQKEVKAAEELLKEMNESVKKSESMKEQIKKMEKETEKIKRINEKISLFTNSLIATQAELREELINTVNQAMDDIWGRIYPYSDFQSAKIEIEEGSYELKVKEKSGKWIRVEGILSGGERSAAAICIRIAFSLVLTQNLSWLILDEPTHNLDRRAVKELANTMKEHLPALVEQIFVITHDAEMEKAASSFLYVLERDKSVEGATIPRMQAIE